jgi:hypothetical protein
MQVQALPKWLALGALSGVLMACGGDDNNNGGGGDTSAELRVVHAVSDAPAVNAGLDGGSQITELGFAEARGFLSVPGGDYDVAVDAILPDGTTTNVIDAPGVTLDADNETTIVAVGNVGAIEPVVATAPDEDPAAGDVRLQVIHGSAAADGAGTLDVYVTAPGADLTDSAVTPVDSFDFKGIIGPTTVPAGDYRIRVTPQGTPGTVVFDSGTVTLNGGSDIVLTAIDNVGPAGGPRSAPIRVLATPEGADAFEILDQGATAAVRAAHFAQDAGTVDVQVDGGPTLFPGVDFTDVSAFANVAAGTYAIDVVPAGGGSPAIDDAPLDVSAGMRYTGYAVGLAADQSLEVIASEDDLRSVATEAKLRVVHGASQAPNVDVYLTDQSTSSGDLGNETPVLTDVPFKAISDFLSVAADDYRVFVTPTGSTSVAIGPVDLTLDAGGVYTVIARDDNPSAPSFAAELVDDSP